MKTKHVFIIAEAGSNWRMGTAARDIKMARALIDVAVDAGADAVKFQTYRAHTVYVPNAGMSDYLSQNGIRESITDIFTDLSMPYELIKPLAQYCGKRKIEFMSSVFSKEDFEAVNPYTKIHKIASYEITHSRLIELTAKSRKPTIISTGAATLDEIDWAVDHFKKNGGKHLSLMQCTAKYPAPLSALNLSVIPTLKNRYKVPIGLSDHSRDAIIGPVAAVALGATLIEKHYTLDNRLPGPDHAFAATPEELKAMVRAIRDCEQVIGHGKKVVLADENELRSYAQRALQVITPVRKGEKLLENVNFAILRPGKQRQGIHPKNISRVHGKKATRNIPLGSGIQSNDFNA